MVEPQRIGKRPERNNVIRCATDGQRDGNSVVSAHAPANHRFIE